MCDELEPEPQVDPVSQRQKKLGFLGGGALSLFDQGIVSGTNFLTTIIVGRAAGEVELGFYSLAFAIIVFVLAVQESLIVLPYTVFTRRAVSGKMPAMKGTALAHFGLLTSLISPALLLIGGTLCLLAGSTEFGEIFLLLGVATVCTSFRDLVRRIAFADLELVTAIKLDLLASVTQLGGLLVLASVGLLNAVSALGWIGGACTVSATIVCVIRRPTVAFSRRTFKPALSRNWRYGRWLLMGQIFTVANGYLMHWLLAILVSTAEAGIFAACMTLLFFANPLVIGVGNYLAPVFSGTVAASGNRSLRRPVILASLFLIGALMPVFLAAALFGDPILQFLFGERFAGQGHVISIIAFTILLRAVGVPAENALRAMNRASESFAGVFANFLVSITCALFLIPRYEIAGAAYSMLAGYTVGNLVRWLLVVRSMREE